MRRAPTQAPAQAAPGGRACRSASAAAAPAPQSPTAPCSPAGSATAPHEAPQHQASRPPPHPAGPRPHSRPAAAAARPPSCARHHRRLRHPSLPQQHSLDLARLDPEPAQLHLRVRATQKLQHPVRHATAPGPRSGTSATRRPANRHAGPPQTAPPSAPHASDSPAPAQRPRCTARPQRPPAPAQDQPSRTYARVFQIGRPIGTSARAVAAAGPARHVDRGLGRTVQVLQLHLRQIAGDLIAKLRRQRLAAADDPPQARKARGAGTPASAAERLSEPLLDKRLQHRRHEVQRRHALLADRLPPAAPDRGARPAQPPPAAPPRSAARRTPTPKRRS